MNSVPKLITFKIANFHSLSDSEIRIMGANGFDWLLLPEAGDPVVAAELSLVEFLLFTLSIQVQLLHRVFLCFDMNIRPRSLRVNPIN